MITDRDKQVLEFLRKFKVATTDTIADIFYPSLRVAQRRLKILYENKALKRDREHFTSQFYYYIQKPKQLRHSILLTDFYRELNKIANIEFFESEFAIEHVRADALAAYRIKNRGYIAFVEVQIANMPLDIEKYENLYRSELYKKYFPVFPLIIAITDKNIPKTDLKVIQLNEKLENLKETVCEA